MRNVIFIVSMTHSGSTLLNIILGGNSRMIALGEIFQLLKGQRMLLLDKQNDQCSCGSKVRDCVFWGEVSVRMLASDASDVSDASTLIDRYRVVQDVFEKQFGADAVIVDSSKHIEYVRLLESCPNVNLRVIHLLKDVRAFCISQIDDAKRKQLGQKKRLALYHFMRWHKISSAAVDYLDASGFPLFRLGYEELALYPEKIIKRVCEAFQLTFESSMLQLDVSGSHIVHGNRMREQKGKSEQILYDNRWFYRTEWILPSLLFSKISRFNRQLVYQNETDELWRK